MLSGSSWRTIKTSQEIADYFGIQTSQITSQIVLIYVNGDVDAFNGSILGNLGANTEIGRAHV